MAVLAHRQRPSADLRPALAILIVIGTLLSGGLATSLARLTDTGSSDGTFTTDRLSPPSGLGATGGATVALSWTATPKAWAEGYTIWRAASSGGTYSQIGTVTPRTTVTYADSPAAGTYFYKVRAYYQNWVSAFDGPVSATVGSPSTSTGYKDCAASSNAADTVSAGDNNGYESNPGNGCSLDGSFAVDGNSGIGGTQSCGSGATPDIRKDRHRWWGYAFDLPGSVTSIDGIQVQATLKLNNNGGTSNICAQLTWDGGTTWTTMKTQDVSGGNALTTYTFGAMTDTWGHTPWTIGQLNSTNFRVRLIDGSSMANKDYSLDALLVQVTYTP